MSKRKRQVRKPEHKGQPFPVWMTQTTDSTHRQLPRYPGGESLRVEVFFLSNTSASLDMTASLGSEEVAYHFPASWTWRSRVLTSVCPHRCLALSVWDLSQWPPCRERDNCELLLINRLFPENPSPPASSRTRAYFVVLEIIIPTEWILAPRRPHPRPLCLL